jgi:hypothetical protein
MDSDLSTWPLGLEREPPLGAHLTTSRRGYAHHGPVEEVSLSRFAVGRPVQTVEHERSPFSAEEIVLRARSRIGENDYRLLTNNCEHFCNWCLDGISHSAQVERRLQLPFRTLLALFHT